MKKVLTLLIVVAMMLTMSTVVLASEGGTDGAAAGGSMWTTVIMIVAMVAIFYFFMIRPENKKKKKMTEMRNSLSVGDNVTTIGGIMGKVVNISDDTITFETSEDRVRVKVAKWAISTVGKDAPEEQPK